MKVLPRLVPAAVLSLLFLVTFRLWAQSGPGYRVQMVVASVGAPGSVLMYTTTGGTSIPACLPFNSRVVWQAVGGGFAVAYTGDQDPPFSADINAATGHHLNDTGEVGTRNTPAVGLRLNAGERSHSQWGTVDYQQVKGGPGYRTGLCTTALETPVGVTKRFPCFDDSDCPAGGGTCELEASLLTTVPGNLDIYRARESCTYVRVQTDTADAVISCNLTPPGR